MYVLFLYVLSTLGGVKAAASLFWSKVADLLVLLHLQRNCLRCMLLRRKEDVEQQQLALKRLKKQEWFDKHESWLSTETRTYFQIKLRHWRLKRLPQLRGLEGLRIFENGTWTWQTSYTRRCALRRAASWLTPKVVGSAVGQRKIRLGLGKGRRLVEIFERCCLGRAHRQGRP